ncbi:MAG: hypothetical protein ACXWKP_22040 [Bradyrhizobium sp.]
MRKLLMASALIMGGMTTGFAQAHQGAQGASPQSQDQQSQEQMQKPDDGRQQRAGRDDDRDPDRGFRDRDEDGRADAITGRETVIGTGIAGDTIGIATAITVVTDGSALKTKTAMCIADIWI